MALQIQKIGGFTALNTGRIEDCFAHMHTPGRKNAAGFCGENKGTLRNCFSKGRVSGGKKEKRSGFCAQQHGKMEGCFWLHGGQLQDPERWTDADRGVEDSALGKETERLLRTWDTEHVWSVTRKSDESVELGLFDVSEPPRSCARTVEISSAKELLELAQTVNGGESHADVLYRLTQDINLGGRAWTPIGLDPNAPFQGCFDGGGHTIQNFTVNAGKHPYAGLFGCTDCKAEIHGLTVDCVLTGHGTHAAPLCASNGGLIADCTARSGRNTSRYTGGLAGQNSGAIRRSCALGRIAPMLAIPWWLPLLALLILFLIPPISFRAMAMSTPPTEVFAPIIIDPNAKPIDPDDPDIPAPPSKPQEDTSATFIMNAAMNVSTENYAGAIGLRCPTWSTRGFVATAYLTRDALAKYGLPAGEDAVLYESGLIKPGYGIDVITLSPLPDGTKLPVGEYELTVRFDFYNVETNERSAVNSTAPLDVTVY